MAIPKEVLTPIQHARKWVSGDLIKVKYNVIAAYRSNDFETWVSSGRYPYKCEKVPQNTILFFLGEIRRHPTHNSFSFAKVWWNKEIFWVCIDDKLRLIHQGKPRVQNP